jgi:predicted outer membrane lipoprotein
MVARTALALAVAFGVLTGMALTESRIIE